MKQKIKFWRTRDIPHGVFSNFLLCNIEIDNKIWRSVEHYYQAQKFSEKDKKELCLTCEEQ
jgi:N-glycosidase YbiA